MDQEHPHEKKGKISKWLSGEALQIAVKRRETKSKGKKENNRMGKLRDLFKKIRDNKGTLHAKMGMIKDRNSMDLTKAEDAKKR